MPASLGKPKTMPPPPMANIVGSQRKPKDGAIEGRQMNLKITNVCCSGPIFENKNNAVHKWGKQVKYGGGAHCEKSNSYFLSFFEMSCLFDQFCGF